MAKRKDLLLKESTISRMMGLAGIGSLTNPFLREERNPTPNQDHGWMGDQEEDEEEEMDEGKCPKCGSMLDEERMCECGYGKMEEELDDMSDEDVASSGGQDPEDYLSEESDPWSDLAESYEDEEEEEEDEEEDEEDDEEEDDEEDDEEDESLQENINASLKRLKRLLEQAEPAPAGGEAVPPEVPPADEGGAGGDEVETKIKDFVKKMGELIQDTLGVEVKVEEGEGEEEEKAPAGEAGAMPPAPPAGGAAAAPLAEAINRLVNKVAYRVKARLMEAKKDPKAAATKAKKMKMMKEKQMAEKKKKMEMEAKKKKLEMERKKKAAMAKKK